MLQPLPPTRSYTVQEFITAFKHTMAYLYKKKLAIIIVSLLFVLAGLCWSYFAENKFVATVTFSNETNGEAKRSVSSVAGQIGIILANDDSYYEGKNLLAFLKSRELIMETLLLPIDGSNTKKLLDLYCENHSKNPSKTNESLTSRAQDSVLNTVCDMILKNKIDVAKTKTYSSFVTVSFTDHNEEFTKIFIEKFIGNAIKYYTNYKTEKAIKERDILKQSSDSLGRIVSYRIEESADFNDLTMDPLREIAKTAVDKKEFDKRVTSVLYGESLKHLEAANIRLKQETPFLEIVEKPVYPLDNIKATYLFTGFILGVLGFALSIMFFLIKRIVDAPQSRIFIPSLKSFLIN